MSIRPTGNEWFDKLYQSWVDITQNTNEKHRAQKEFERLTRKGSEIDKERMCNEIIASLTKKQAARDKLATERRFVPEWCSLAVYIKNRRYLDDDVGDKPKKDKPVIKCGNHPDRESVYAVAPFLCCECISKQIMQNDPIVNMMRQYYVDNDIKNKSMSEVIAMCKKNISKMGYDPKKIIGG